MQTVFRQNVDVDYIAVSLRGFACAQLVAVALLDIDHGSLCGQSSHALAMGASSEFQFGVQVIKFFLGRIDFDTHATDPLKLATTSHRLASQTGHSV